MLIRKEGNPTYSSIENILVNSGIPEDVAYETLNISLNKIGLSSGTISEKDIDNVYETLKEALIISITRVKLSKVHSEMIKLKDHK